MTVSSTTAASTAATTTGSTLGSLSGNFQDFLKLLMTQLQNQDPTKPMDTNEFTSQLVQFASVEQQINTNTSLTKLIQATQGGEILQSSSLVGKQVQVASDHLALQNGQGTVQFSSSSAQAVSVGVYSDAGIKLRDATVTSVSGTNTWTWDGRDNTGTKLADGAYRVVVADSAGTVMPFTIGGTVTGVTRKDDAVTVQLGGLTADFTKVQSVGTTN